MQIKIHLLDLVFKKKMAHLSYIYCGGVTASRLKLAIIEAFETFIESIKITGIIRNVFVKRCISLITVLIDLGY